MPDARAWHTVTRLGDGRVLVLGGDDADGWPVDSAWIYGWSAKPPGNSATRASEKRRRCKR
jgi:hypothetical protein